MSKTSQVKEITAKLEQGVKDLWNSDSYANYLKTMSRFHKYSTRNTLLIHMQRPDASFVAGFRSWQTKFSRNVKKGEKAIKILAPAPFVIREEKEKLDPETRLPVLGEDGMPIVEYTEKQLARFKVTNVFDVKQTDGEPLPTLIQDLTGNVEQYEAFMDALKTISPLPIVIEQMPEDTDGACIYGDRIAIREGMSEIQTISAVIHEITHAKLHDLESLRLMDKVATPKDRSTQEVEAESVSYAVCQYFNIETGANSFGYVMEWSKNRELNELNASLDTIRKTAAELIDGIEGKFKELVKERNITLAVGEAQISLDELPDETRGTTPLAIDFSTEQALDTATTDSTNPPASNISAVLEQYGRHTKVAGHHEVGSNILVTPLFNNGNFNREGKKIWVVAERPIGKYEIFSREEHGDKNLYFLTASGRVDRLSQYFKSEWDDTQNKWVNIRPTEDELDKAIIAIANTFERDMADPTKWAMYQHAAVVDRLDECEAHNKPVRELMDAEDRERYAEEERASQEEKQQAIAKFDSRVDEIAKAIELGEVISVRYDEHAFDGKNPVLDLFKLYNITLPLRTQGWVNTGLAEITEDGYRYFTGKNKGDSTTFGGYLDKLRDTIAIAPIELKRQHPVENTKGKKTLENKLYDKFAALFPQFANGEYNYLKLEAGKSMMPLSLNYIFGDRISIMHTYKLNGDTCYDPMMEFRFDNIGKTMSASTFEQSIPPIYQFFDDDGIGTSVDGNGNHRIIVNLQAQLDDFASMWINNISQQGYIPVRGIKEIDGEDVEVLFDVDGMPIMPEAENPEIQVGDTLLIKDKKWRVEEINSDFSLELKNLDPNDIQTDQMFMGRWKERLEDEGYEIVTTHDSTTKEYSLGYGFLGNGISVWNRADERNGEYAKVAHIEYDRTIKYHDNAVPDEVKKGILNAARTMVDDALAPLPISNIQEQPKTTELDLSLPDPTVTAADINVFGYSDSEMLPLSNLRAVELFDTDHPIYLLYPDGTEGLAIDRNEILTYEGYCGIERADWERSPVRAAQMAVAVSSEGSREAELVHGNESMFGIYQIPDGIDEARNFRFAPMREIEALGLEVDRNNYKLVYTAPLTTEGTQASLNTIFLNFNSDERPADYTGRSLSVSDIIVLQQDGEISSHYVDSVGFEELLFFVGDERQKAPATQVVAQDKEPDKEPNTYSQVGNSTNMYTGPTVAELEADVNDGKSISLFDLSKAIKAEQNNSKPRNTPQKGKPSLMERLEDGKRKAAQNGQQQPSTKKEERD